MFFPFVFLFWHKTLHYFIYVTSEVGGGVVWRVTGDKEGVQSSVTFGTLIYFIPEVLEGFFCRVSPLLGVNGD